MLRKTMNVRRYSRRASVVVQVAVASTVVLGMGALAIDVGALYTAQTELQISCDAAALAGAAQLVGKGNVQAKALAEADKFARLNKVMGLVPAVYPEDMEFGRAELDPSTNRFDFRDATANWDAVRLTLQHLHTDVPNERPTVSIPLTFAQVFGLTDTELTATATAMLVPRDIAVVVDLSNSMGYDSQIRWWNRDDGGYSNLRDIWAALDGPEPSRPYLPTNELESEYANDVGPTIGSMSVWGNALIPGEYDPTQDPGLYYLPRGSDWTNNPGVEDLLIQQGYDEWERWAILTNEMQGYLTAPATDSKGFTSRVIFHENATDSRHRVTVFLTSDASGGTPALSNVVFAVPYCGRSTAAATAQSSGQYNIEVVDPDPHSGLRGIKFEGTLGEDGAVETHWFSFEVPSSCDLDDLSIACKAGPGWDSVKHDSESVDTWNYDRWRYRVAVVLGLAEWEDGDGDGKIESSSELDWQPKFAECWNWSWYNYIDHVRSSGVYNGSNWGFKYRYGLKTFADFLLDKKPESWATCGLYQTPELPLRSVKDAVNTMIDELIEQDSLDHASLQIYGLTTKEEVDLTDNLALVPDQLYDMQNGHYDRYTNMGGGLQEAINTFEKQDSLARSNAHKVIILMSDGKPNVDAYGNIVSENAQPAVNHVIDQATYAADQGYRIYTVSVGYGVNRDVMQQVAAIGKGQEFYAHGNPTEYTAELMTIFSNIGGKRPVALIQ